MLKPHKLRWALAVLATLAAYSVAVQPACAKGGGHHGGGHHGGHHAGHHGGHNHHPYHPSHHHNAHHSSHHHHGDHHHGDHRDHHHYAHHHHSWHHGGWGPGFWGGAALGYGLGGGYNNWGGWGYNGGGDTYVDNATNVIPAGNESDNSSDDATDASAPNGTDGFPTDDWPELGVVTYAGQYGGSQGQVIVRVVPGSAAEKAGLVPGDVILTFNGKPVPSADDLDAAMDAASGQFEVSVWDARTGRKSTVSGALDPAAPQTNETAAIRPAQQ